MPPYEASLAAGAYTFQVMADPTKWPKDVDPNQVIQAQTRHPDDSQIWLTFQTATQFPEKGLTRFTGFSAAARRSTSRRSQAMQDTHEEVPIIMKSLSIRAGLLAVLAWSVTTACATSSGVRLPPGFTVPWNIRPANSVVEQEFVVREYRIYTLEIQFGTTEWGIPLEQKYQFTGDGTYHRVTKESADTDHPVVVPENTPEELEFLKGAGFLVEGEYFTNHPLQKNQRVHIPPAGTVWRSASPGVIVPVHILIERLDSAVGTTIHTDRDIDTKNIVAGGSGGLLRRITAVKLKPGKYRLTANTTRESRLPSFFYTSLKLAPFPNARGLDDND